MTEEHIKEETPNVPEICTRCGNYLPQFYRIIVTKECAAFVTCEGVKGNRCGAFARRIEAPMYTATGRMGKGPMRYKGAENKMEEAEHER